MDDLLGVQVTLGEVLPYTKVPFRWHNVPPETRVSAYPTTRSEYDIVKANWYYGLLELFSYRFENKLNKLGYP